LRTARSSECGLSERERAVTPGPTTRALRAALLIPSMSSIRPSRTARRQWKPSGRSSPAVVDLWTHVLGADRWQAKPL